MSKKKNTALVLVAVFVGLAAIVVFTLTIFVLFLSSRNPGEVKTESRAITDFDQIVFEGYGDVEIKQGKPEGLAIKAQEKVLDRINTEVKDGVLTIKPTRRFLPLDISLFRKEVTPKYFITIEDLSSLTITGAANISIDELFVNNLEINIDGAGNTEIGSLFTQDLEINLNGAGNLEIAGLVDYQKITLNGAGNYRSFDLESQDADVILNGLGNIQVYVKDKLDVEIDGAGNVEYKGSPDDIDKSVNGLGKVQKAD